jgi:PRTRC genetic system protein E
MFKQLAPIINAGTNLCIMVSAAPEGNLTVTILPQSKDGQSTALSTPLSVTATPDELDSELPAALTSYVGHRASLAETLENVKTIMEAAGKTASEQATKAATKTTSEASCVESDEENDELDDEYTKATPEKATIGRTLAAPSPKVDPDLTLF